MRVVTAVVVVAVTALGCGRSHSLESEAGSEDGSPVDAGFDAETVVPAADGRDGSDTAADAFVHGLPVLSPPPVDCAPFAGVAGCVVRATVTGSTDGDGLSWATALSDPQAAIDRATCGCEVWIAEGTFLPTRSLDGPGEDPDPRNRSFVLWRGVKVFGGFAGDETTRAGRIPGQHETILTGDLGERGIRQDNAYHVVFGADGAMLDDLTIRDGEASGFHPGQGVGAGLFNVGASMTLRSVRITDNVAGTGAGIYNDEHSAPALFGCTLARNVADVGGGMATTAALGVIDKTTFSENVGVFVGAAIAHEGGALTVRDSTFVNNRGDYGGAIALSDGETRVERCWFEANKAGLFGGALIVRTGAKAHVSSSVMVANASVGHGGAIAVWTATLDVAGTTIVGNSGAFGGAFLIKDAAQVTVTDSLVWRNPDDVGKTFFIEGAGNVLDASTCDIPAEAGGPSNFESDPRLANVPLLTRFAEAKGTTDEVRVTAAESLFKVGDRIELGDDGIERRVAAINRIAVRFTPALATATPRWLRVDLWPESAPNLTLDLIPTSASPLIDGASATAPLLDVAGRARVDVPGTGAACGAVDAGCAVADIGAIELEAN